MNGIVLMPPAGISDKRPYRISVDLKPKYSSISPVVSPEMHSKQVDGLAFRHISAKCFLQFCSVVFTISSTPKDFKIGIYSALLTVHIVYIAFFQHSLISILPICEQAAVMMTHFDFNYFSLSTMHTAVIGLTTKEATSSKDKSSLIGKA